MLPEYESVKTAVLQDLQSVEQQRKEMVLFMLRSGLGFAAAALLFVLAFYLHIEPLMIVSIVGLALVLVISILWTSKKRNHLRIQYKEKVVGRLSQEMLRLCELPDETAAYQYHSEYDHTSRISDSYILGSQLFDNQIDRIYGEDLFSGKLGLTEFQFSEITLKQIRVHRNANGHTSRREVTVFDGILFVADFHKDFEGTTILKSANWLNSNPISGMLQPLTNLFSAQKRVKIDLENEQFNAAFDLQTTDEIKARYILTPSMMERILHFKQHHPEKIEISFVHSLMCIALSSGKNYFEPAWFSPIDDVQIQTVYDDLCFFYGLVEEFNLNTRIWNKQ